MEIGYDFLSVFRPQKSLQMRDSVPLEESDGVSESLLSRIRDPCFFEMWFYDSSGVMGSEKHEVTVVQNFKSRHIGERFKIGLVVSLLVMTKFIYERPEELQCGYCQDE